jgi:phage tail P2-like protein
MDRVLPSQLQKYAHIVALEDTIDARFSAIDMSQLLMYMVDTVASAALPYLADQFDVAGVNGYAFATTDAQKRDLIKNAIDLKKYMGTVYAIKLAMQSTGFGGATLVEGAGTVGDGNDWARFRITVDLGLTAGVDATTPVTLTTLINRYKNVRSELIDIAYNCNIFEYLPDATEDMDYALHTDLTDTMFVGTYRYDGAHKYDGSIKYKPGVEDLQVTII